MFRLFFLLFIFTLSVSSYFFNHEDGLTFNADIIRYDLTLNQHPQNTPQSSTQQTPSAEETNSDFDFCHCNWFYVQKIEFPYLSFIKTHIFTTLLKLAIPFDFHQRIERPPINYT